VSKLIVKPMDDFHGPGWSIKLEEQFRLYQLWAPGGRRHRDYWAAGWSREEGYDGAHARGSLDLVFDCFPKDPEGYEARDLLLEAALKHIGKVTSAPSLTEFTNPDSLPAHYIEAGPDKGRWCPEGGTVPETPLLCPRCGTVTHYSNDGHEACEEVPKWD
jgi:hypothetical protein